MKYGFIPEPSNTFRLHYDIANLAFPGESHSDLRKFSLSRHNQLETSSCVAQSIIKGLEVLKVRKNGPEAHEDLSRSALYYLTREIMGPPFHQVDNGSYISTAAQVLRKFGVCRENPRSSTDRQFWPFDVSRINKSPSVIAMRSAYVNKISSFYAIHETGENRSRRIIQALAAGHPVIFGTKVYANFQNYRGGTWESNSGSLLGGHATCLVGWDGRNFIGENSWGPFWGDDGFYYASPRIIESSESSDFIVLY